MTTSAPQNKSITAANAVVFGLIVAACLVGVNIIGSRYFGRVDITNDKVYTLSDASKSLVKNLPDRLNVKLFITNDRQPPLYQYGQYVRDLLDEYKNASNGMFEWEAIDPLEGKDAEEKQKKQEELGKYKIQKITLQRFSKAKLEIGADNYLGIGISYGEKVESIPQITSTEGIEYELTSTIRRLLETKKKKLGFVTSEGELSPSQGLRMVGSLLGKDYETTTVTLDKPIPDDIDGLVVAGPKQPFGEKPKFYLDQFLMKGKAIAFFVDGMIVEQPQGMQQMPGMEAPRIGRANDTNLQDLFGKYGFKVNDDLIFDEQNERGPMPLEGQTALANYPTFVAVGGEGALSLEFAPTKSLPAMIMPFPSSLELTGAGAEGKGDVKATWIARTSKSSWRNSGFFLFNPRTELHATADAKAGPFELGYVLKGKFKSAFPGGEPGADPGTSDPAAGPSLKESPDSARILVMGSSGMLNDDQLLVRYLQVYQLNLLFATSVMDWLILDDSLTALRAKGLGARPLTVPPEAPIELWRLLNVLGIPLAVIVFGLVHWRLRASRRANAKL